jgi:cytochrome d ubiquinol oxidase subunit I
MKLSLICGSIVLVLQLISADDTARGVAQNQPIKLAAMEGIYDTKPYTPIGLIAYVDTKNETVKGIQIPGVLSFLTYHDFKTPVPGLKDFPRDEWPNVPAVFQMYHLMILMWVLMFFCVIFAVIFWRKKILDKSKWLLRALVITVIFPQLANQAGWFTAEMGRQPWLVYKLLRTVHGVSASIQSGQVVASIIMFIVIYILLFALFIYLLDQKIKHGPEDHMPSEYRNPFNNEENA